jgi:hypothetical protein
MDIDETIRQMMADEEEDAPCITPVNYGHLRGMAPQLVYYHIKAGHIVAFRCECGRRVVRKEEADDYFRSVGKLQPKREGPTEPAPLDGAGGPDES